MVVRLKFNPLFHQPLANTMNRCSSPSLLTPMRRWRGVLILVIVALSWFGTAQTNKRHFPEKAVRGLMVVQQPPSITMDGLPDRLAPGSRIHNTQNLLVLSGTLVGQQLVVNYTRENTGLVYEVWILTPDEAQDAPIRPRTPVL